MELVCLVSESDVKGGSHLAKEVFDKVYQAEAEAKRIIVDAKEEADFIQQGVKEQLKNIKENYQQQLTDYEETLQRDLRSDIAEKEEAVIGHIETEKVHLKEAFEKNREEMTDYIVQVVLARYGRS